MKQYLSDYLSNYGYEKCDISGLYYDVSKYKQKASFYKNKELLLCESTSQVLMELCSNNEINFLSLIQFVWHKILNMYSNCEKTIVEVESENFCIPFYVNHSDHDKMTIMDSLVEIQSLFESMTTCQKEIITTFGNKLHTGLIESKIFYQKDIAEKSLNKKLKYSINLFLDDRNCAIKLTIAYDANGIDARRVDDVLKICEELFEQIATNPSSKISDIHYLNIEQIESLSQWNKESDFEVPLDKTINELFEEQVKRRPENIAIIFEQKKLTYKELDDASNRLTYLLDSTFSNRIESNSPFIALFLDQSEHMIISILSVLKFGAAYVPIDPSYNDGRIEFILNDTKAKIVLTNKTHLKRLKSIISQFNPTNSFRLIAVDDDEFEKAIDNCSLKSESFKKRLGNSVDRFCYVIYTSGTTGKPKGVLVPHKGVVNFILDITRRYKLFGGSDDEYDVEVVFHFYNYAFDASVEQILFALLNSHVLVMCKRDLLLDHEKFYSYLNENKVTHLNATPSFLHQYNLSKIKHLRRLCVSGEAFSEAFYKKITNEFKGPILNGYGPTECSIGSIVNLISHKKDNIYSIGSLVSNLKCYLLNKNKQLVPIGALGELYIGGVGVTKGYLNRDDMTRDRFVSNPFQTDLEKELGKNERLYKTGDLMRWLENNELQFIGRNDFQFKIRGYRIELAEIENCITSFKGIQQSCVIPKENKLNNKFLVAFYTCNEQINENELVAYVKLKLPNYMQPSQFRRIEKMPLTANGKLNTQQLAQIDIFANSEQKTFKIPSNELEMAMLKIWSNSLGIEQENISVDDEFEKLGGTSLLVCTITEQLQHDLNLSIQPIDVFKLKTINNLSKQFLSEFLENKGNNELFIDNSCNKTLISFKRFYFKFKDNTQKNSIEFQSYVILNENKVDTVFIFPPKYGGAETYFNNLVPKLSKNRIVLFNNQYQYLLKNANIHHSDQEPTYETLAEYYYKLIKSIQHNRPYNLLGWSFGGILAIETARLLANENSKIDSLVIIDSYFGLSTQSIGLVDKHERIDEVYKPKDYYFTSRIPTFVIYKASKCVEMCENTRKLINSFNLEKKVIDDLVKISSIYSKTNANKLDLFLENINSLSCVDMSDEDHFSWERNESILKNICSHFN